MVSVPELFESTVYIAKFGQLQGECGIRSEEMDYIEGIYNLHVKTKSAT